MNVEAMLYYMKNTLEEALNVKTYYSLLDYKGTYGDKYVNITYTGNKMTPLATSSKSLCPLLFELKIFLYTSITMLTRSQRKITRYFTAYTFRQHI